VCCANCLQPDKQNDNGWDQGLVFLSPDKVWAQPPYYVTQMLARRYLPRIVQADVSSPKNTLDVTAKTDDKGNVLQLQSVHLKAERVTDGIQVSGFKPREATGEVVELGGPLDAVNTAAEPRRVAPVEREWRHGLKGGSTQFTFSERSFTIVRLK